MRPRGRCFDGSDSMFRTQQDMMKRAGHAVWLNEFTPTKIDHLGFVNRLLHTFCELDICCALVNAYPSYIAGVISVFSTAGPRLSLLYLARVDSPLLDSIYNKVPFFQIGPFSFILTDNERFENFHDYSVYAITLLEDTVGVLIGVVETSTITCGSKSSINFLEFLWESTIIFAFTKYGIVCVPFDPPKVLYLRHHEATSGGWTQSSLCRPCLVNYRPVIDKFLPICAASSSCKCHMPPSTPVTAKSCFLHAIPHN